MAHVVDGDIGGAADLETGPGPAQSAAVAVELQNLEAWRLRSSQGRTTASP
jgi:hypothetical protein